MNSFEITIDDQSVSVSPGQTVLSAARSLGLDIPTLCYLERCGPLTSCLVCVVKINGKLVPACGTTVQAGMAVESETDEVREARRTALELLFSDHVGDCLSPCTRLCPLGLNIPVMIRQVQEGRMPEAAATVRKGLPLAGVLGRLCHHPCEQGCRRGACDHAVGIRDTERSVTDWEARQEARTMPATVGTGQEPTGVPSIVTASGRKMFEPTLAENSPQSPAQSGRPRRKTVVIVGAGPTGLSAACYLAAHGHVVTVVDRHQRCGGTLRDVPESELPAAVLESDVAHLAQAGVEFRLGVELGEQVSIEGLLRGFDALLLTIGEVGQAELARIRVPWTGGAIEADPNTCQTKWPRVFAAGAAVRPVRQLVRAMAEGRAAAECIHRFLTGRPVRRPEKAFSSVMGRLDPAELRLFLNAPAIHGPAPLSPGLSQTDHRPSESLTGERAVDAARCLHCDCRASGDCQLQHYAALYGVNPTRFRSERRRFEQIAQPGGVIFEPGKCILCGICVKLTELAREPLGLTFIGRGFDVRVAAPLNHTIQEGLRIAAEDCVRHCPTGALTFNR